MRQNFWNKKLRAKIDSTGTKGKDEDSPDWINQLVSYLISLSLTDHCQTI
jgi:hypothetical protein